MEAGGGRTRPPSSKDEDLSEKKKSSKREESIIIMPATVAPPFPAPASAPPTPILPREFFLGGGGAAAYGYHHQHHHQVGNFAAVGSIGAVGAAGTTTTTPTAATPGASLSWNPSRVAGAGPALSFASTASLGRQQPPPVGGIGLPGGSIGYLGCYGYGYDYGYPSGAPSSLVASPHGAYYAERIGAAGTGTLIGADSIGGSSSILPSTASSAKTTPSDHRNVALAAAVRRAAAPTAPKVFCATLLSLSTATTPLLSSTSGGRASSSSAPISSSALIPRPGVGLVVPVGAWAADAPPALAAVATIGLLPTPALNAAASARFEAAEPPPPLGARPPHHLDSSAAPVGANLAASPQVLMPRRNQIQDHSRTNTARATADPKPEMPKATAAAQEKKRSPEGRNLPPPFGKKMEPSTSHAPTDPPAEGGGLVGEGGSKDPSAAQSGDDSDASSSSSSSSAANNALPTRKKRRRDEPAADEENEEKNTKKKNTKKKYYTAKRSEHWNAMATELRRYRSVHGHCVVRRGDANYRLALWVSEQRKQHRLKEEGKSSNLTDDRIGTLRDMGFVWNAQEAAWDRHLSDLRSFREKYGHAVVPQKCDEFPQLGMWVKEQRRHYGLLRRREEEKSGGGGVGGGGRSGKGDDKKSKSKSGASKMTADRLEALRDLGFVFDCLEASWWEAYGELAEFRDERGHCMVPSKYEPNRKLGTWVWHQRCLYRKMRGGERSAMSNERVEALESLGFVWTPKGGENHRGEQSPS